MSRKRRADLKQFARWHVVPLTHGATPLAETAFNLKIEGTADQFKTIVSTDTAHVITMQRSVSS